MHLKENKNKKLTIYKKLQNNESENKINDRRFKYNHTEELIVKNIRR